MFRLFYFVGEGGGEVLSAPHETGIFWENLDTWVGFGESDGGGGGVLAKL
jgi:hypothetical protein